MSPRVSWLETVVAALPDASVVAEAGLTVAMLVSPELKFTVAPDTGLPLEVTVAVRVSDWLRQRSIDAGDREIATVGVTGPNLACSRPAPQGCGHSVEERGSEWPWIRVRISAGVRVESSASIRAATPATCGAAIEVPL